MKKITKKGVNMSKEKSISINPSFIFHRNMFGILQKK